MGDVYRKRAASARASLIKAACATREWLNDNIRWKPLGRIALAMLPLVVNYCITRDPAVLQSNLILASLYIGAARVGYGLPGLFVHTLVILVAFGVLLFSQHVPMLFAGVATLFATLAVLLGRFRESWRTFGSFSLIPSVYLAMELFDESHGLRLWQTYEEVVRCAVIGAAFLSLFSLMWWIVDQRTDNFLTSFGVAEPPNSQWRVMTLSVLLAEVLATSLIALAHLPNGQWLVWSVVSVVTGDSISARKKLKSRVLGALIGVALGLIVGLAVPPFAAGAGIFSVAAALSLVAFRIYPIEFGARCFFVALAAAMSGSAHYSEVIGLERIGNVLLGSVLGFCALFVVEALRNMRSGELPV